MMDIRITLFVLKIPHLLSDSRETSTCSEDPLILSDSMETSNSSVSGNERLDGENAYKIMLNLRKKNFNRVFIGTILNKMDQLQVIIGNSVDILTIQESKLDEVTTEQLLLNSYNKQYRLDRNRHIYPPEIVR